MKLFFNLAAAALLVGGGAIAAPAQAESLSDCFQREGVQQLTAQVQRQTSVRQMRVDALDRQIKADMAIAEAAGRYLRGESTEDIKKMNAMEAFQRKLDQQAIDKHQIGVGAANLQDALSPSSCYR